MEGLKTKPEYFQAVIDGKKLFEVRKKDRKFKPGDEVRLMEYLGGDFHAECGQYRKGCEVWEEIRDNVDRWDYGQEEAIDECGKNRLRCCEYIEHQYSGRECVIKIKDVFDLKAVGLPDYVAFTFQIASIRDRVTSYSTVEETEE